MQYHREHIEEWREIENEIRNHWMQQNQYPSLRWDEVKDIVKFGWLISKNEDQPVHSIH